MNFEPKRMNLEGLTPKAGLRGSMARPLRIEYPGAFHHVMSRGNDGTSIVRNDTDRLKFLELLVRAIARFGWILHDWVLMTNHVHLSIETPKRTLSDGMHWLLGTYAG